MLQHATIIFCNQLLLAGCSAISHIASSNAAATVPSLFAAAAAAAS
jgi:hypothetical protein